MPDNETPDDDADEKVRVPLDTYKNFQPGGLPPIAPDGGFVPGPIGNPAPVDAATPENFICLRGPCRHYWELKSFMASGNPQETWDPVLGLKDPLTGKPVTVPRQISRSCTAHPGTETDITEDCVYDCSRWSPLTEREVRKNPDNKRREKYLKLHPEHRGPKR